MALGLGRLGLQARRSAVVVPVAAAEPAVSALRARFDPSAAEGMPAHITALFPFLAQRRLRRDLVAELQELCSSRPALEVVFRRTARFDEVLYLQPEPAEGLRQLTLAIAGRWPEAPPYGGRFKEIVPHLTVAHGADEKVLDAVEAELTSHLPLAARLPEAVLYGFDGRCWREHTRLPFSDADAGEGAAPTEAVAGSPEPSTG